MTIPIPVIFKLKVLLDFSSKLISVENVLTLSPADSVTAGNNNIKHARTFSIIFYYQRIRSDQ